MQLDADAVVTLVIEFQDTADNFGWVGEDSKKLGTYDSYKNSLIKEFRDVVGQQGFRTECLLNPTPKGYTRVGSKDFMGPENYYMKKGASPNKGTEKPNETEKPRMMRYPRLGSFEISIRCSVRDLPNDFQVWSKLESRRWPKVGRLVKDIARLLDDEEVDKRDLLNRMQELFSSPRNDSCAVDKLATAVAHASKPPLNPPMFYSLRQRGPISQPTVRLDSATHCRQPESRAPTRPHSARAGSSSMTAGAMRPTSAHIGGRTIRPASASHQQPISDSSKTQQLHGYPSNHSSSREALQASNAMPMPDRRENLQQHHAELANCIRQDNMEATKTQATCELPRQINLESTEAPQMTTNCTKAHGNNDQSEYGSDGDFEGESEPDSPVQSRRSPQPSKPLLVPLPLSPKHLRSEAEKQLLRNVCEMGGQQSVEQAMGVGSHPQPPKVPAPPTDAEKRLLTDIQNEESDIDDDFEDHVQGKGVGQQSQVLHSQTSWSPPTDAKRVTANQRPNEESDFEEDIEDDVPEEPEPGPILKNRQTEIVSGRTPVTSSIRGGNHHEESDFEDDPTSEVAPEAQHTRQLISSAPHAMSDLLGKRQKGQSDFENDFEEDFEEDSDTDVPEKQIPESLHDDSSEFEVQEVAEYGDRIVIDKDQYDYAEDNESYFSEGSFEE